MPEMDMKTIALIVFGIIILYLLYKTRNVEGFAVSDDIINDKIKAIYNADIDAIRNLSSIATDITKKNDMLTIPVGNTIIAGKLTVNGDVEFVNKDNGFMNTMPKFTVLAIYSETVPKGWAPCDGKIYKLNEQGIAIQVVVDGTRTPDLRGRMILGGGEGTGLTNRNLNQTGGKENMSAEDMPAHSHDIINILNQGVGCDGTNCGQDNGGGRFRPISAKSGSSYMSAFLFSRPNEIPTMTGFAGAGGSQNNMPPFYVLIYIMKL
jgi:microcystin-dependent protein